MGPHVSLARRDFYRTHLLPHLHIRAEVEELEEAAALYGRAGASRRDVEDALVRKQRSTAGGFGFGRAPLSGALELSRVCNHARAAVHSKRSPGSWTRSSQHL